MPHGWGIVLQVIAFISAFITLTIGHKGTVKLLRLYTFNVLTIRGKAAPLVGGGNTGYCRGIVKKLCPPIFGELVQIWFDKSSPLTSYAPGGRDGAY